MVTIANWITSAILVHCARGASRSAAILCAYLIQKKNWDYETASSFLKEKRPVVSINPGFQTQLSIFHQHMLYNQRLTLNCWTDKLNKIGANFKEGELVEIWDHKRNCWTEATFLRRTNNFFDVKNHFTGMEETSNLGLIRRNLKILTEEPFTNAIEI